MHIGLIGTGHVGRAVLELFEQRVEMTAWDIQSDEEYPQHQLSKCDFTVVCVDTPSRADGAADISSVVKAVGDLPCEQILLKSTVPPGTTDMLAASTGKHICYWPEFIGESRYYNPFFPSRLEEVPFLILGGPPGTRSWFIDALMTVLGPMKQYYQCSARDAEVIKYMENSFFATKITFVNEMRRICNAVGADWHSVREGWLLDPRVERMHTAAFADAPGFGGKCLPKDLSALVCAADEAGYPAGFLKAVQETNRRFRAEVDLGG